MRFSDKLSKQRKNNNLSQEQLADHLGVSRQKKYYNMLNSSRNCVADELFDYVETHD
jgi:transcriptional regulator with XRE-family HTH domain